MGPSVELLLIAHHDPAMSYWPTEKKNKKKNRFYMGLLPAMYPKSHEALSRVQSTGKGRKGLWELSPRKEVGMEKKNRGRSSWCERCQARRQGSQITQAYLIPSLWPLSLLCRGTFVIRMPQPTFSHLYIFLQNKTTLNVLWSIFFVFSIHKLQTLSGNLYETIHIWL